MGDASTLDAKTRASWHQLQIGFDQRPLSSSQKSNNHRLDWGGILISLGRDRAIFLVPSSPWVWQNLPRGLYCLRAHSLALTGKIGPNSGEAPVRVEPEVCSTIAMERLGSRAGCNEGAVLTP
jgi:hypothetical protein